MKRILRIIAGLGVLLLIIGAVAFFVLNEPLPKGRPGPEAEALAIKMQEAVGAEALEEKTGVLSWTFANKNHYVWDPKRSLVQVAWGDTRVLLNLSDWPKGKAFEKEVEVTDERLDVLRGKAYQYFVNDSFWLVAPTKTFDEGVERAVVVQPDGSKALLVTYSSGGVTPGDSYLWHLDADGLPVSYQMWVSIIPIGGLKATWENWITLETGLKVPTKHQLGPLTIPITDAKSGIVYSEIGLDKDPFELIL
ncbi:hypothetical protein [Arundinibacter roseus]|uniref:Uncharacterized protein n=1 Tax=Arundinibacter roseus TaxID=2070510 RepID=A0A4V2X9S9_9BACT|nr:hypothetical protein [Arundinibacter roseus]TDB64575.1 hypothetical protein EZE20_12965 [Arundinibacter roseus]